MLVGLLASLATAIFKAGTDVTFKLAGKVVRHDAILLLVQRSVEALVALAVIFFGAFFLHKGIALPRGVFEPGFWMVATASAVLGGLALYLTIKALRLSDVSLVSPMTQLTPLILLVTSPLMLGEQLTFEGVLGVMGVVAGSYCMGLGVPDEAGGMNPFGSFRRLFSDKGVQCALLASLLYGVTSNLDKMAVAYTSPAWWIFIHALTICIPLYAFTRFSRARERLLLSRGQLGLAALPGITGGAGSLLQMVAISYWPVPYVIAVKRLSSVISVLSGSLLFKERNGPWRMVGALIMVASTVVVVLYG